MKLRWFIAVGAAGLTVIFAAACNGIAGIEKGDPRDGPWCSDVSDCKVQAPECRTAVACSEGQCEYGDAADGTELAEQTPGDCARVVCDGAGRRRHVADENDVFDDGKLCTEDYCEGTRVHNEPRLQLSCYGGSPGTAGVGVCRAGVQYCNQSGDPLGGCQGQIVPDDEVCGAAGMDEDCDGQANEEGENCVCVPGSSIPCYPGPPGTEGIGACHAGTAQCVPSGLNYGNCKGDVPPAAEICDDAMTDEDCDGAINEEGSNCTCGDGYVSNGEECDDGNQSAFDACTALCKKGVCGDGAVNYGETCDDGNASDGDTCPASCLRPIHILASGSCHNCALLVDGQLKCWGANGYGQLGQGDMNHRGDQLGELGDALPLVNLGADTSILAAALGSDHTCALLEGGAIKCWGHNDSGFLGLGDTERRGDRPGEMGDNLPAVNLGAGKTAVAIAVGYAHTCALLDGGSVKCWGHNDSGQLGLGNTYRRGDNPDEMGDNLPAVNLGAGKTAVAIACGWHHTCAVLEGGSVKCWGYNDYGQLGLGYHYWRGDEPGEMDNLPVVDLGTGKRAIAIAAGEYHTCALLEGGAIKCWGLNFYGQLGLSDTEWRGDESGEMGDSLPLIDLGTDNTAVAITAGQFHTCALLKSGDVKCWGGNEGGQLGLGNQKARGDEPGEMGDSLPLVDLGTGNTAVAIAGGRSHTCSVLSDGRAKCWGANWTGQLGLGDKQSHGGALGQMGDQLPSIAP